MKSPVGNPSERLVGVENVSHCFPAPEGGKDVLALDAVNMEIMRGEMVAFIGPSGCGKSTLLNVIGGMISPTSGAALVNGQAVSGPLPKQIAYIFQESALLPWATVLDNIKVGLEFQGVPKEDREGIAAAALKSVGLEAFAASYPHQLSGGMKQRVALARALSLRTDILLMDEPFAALDEQTRMIFGEDLSRPLASQRKTIVLVTHSLAEAVLLCDRIFVFTSRPGRIKAVLMIDEPHPRTPSFMTSQRFSDLRNELYELLRDEVLAAIGNDRQGLS